jgi:hypothetical protein
MIILIDSGHAVDAKSVDKLGGAQAMLGCAFVRINAKIVVQLLALAGIVDSKIQGVQMHLTSHSISLMLILTVM